MTPELPPREVPTREPLARNAGPNPDPASIAAGETVPPNQLTPEEQMALFEKELKETDWGHQPC